VTWLLFSTFLKEYYNSDSITVQYSANTNQNQPHKLTILPPTIESTSGCLLSSIEPLPCPRAHRTLDPSPSPKGKHQHSFDFELRNSRRSCHQSSCSLGLPPCPWPRGSPPSSAPFGRCWTMPRMTANPPGDTGCPVEPNGQGKTMDAFLSMWDIQEHVWIIILLPAHSFIFLSK
jgi:hypothetical protein